eukprot:895851-Alexandrium_andersonii.AAC.1
MDWCSRAQCLLNPCRFCCALHERHVRDSCLDVALDEVEVARAQQSALEATSGGPRRRGASRRRRAEAWR